MAEATNPEAGLGNSSAGGECQTGQFQVFNDLTSFSKAIGTAAGVTFDLSSMIQLNTDLLQAAEHYLLLNVKEYGVENPNNILFLFEDKAFIFSTVCPSPSAFKPFDHVLAKPSGIGTVLCFLILDKIIDNHKKQLESFLEKINRQEQRFDQIELRKVNLEIERFSDRIEEFHDLVLELQERRYRQLRLDYISFDYRLLIAESSSLQARVRRRLDHLKRIQQDHSIRASEDLNKKVLKLNDVVTRLTAITVIFMLPTLVASHFGMNFKFMPELDIPWVYPAVVIGQISVIAAGILIFKRIGWI